MNAAHQAYTSTHRVGVSPLGREELLDQEEAPVTTQPSSESETSAEWTAIIERIVTALNVAPSAFVQLDEPECDKVRTLAENAEALEIFAGITERDARQRCLAYLRWIAGNPTSDKGHGG